MPVAYRFSKAKFGKSAKQMLSGDGGLYGSARWHTKGQRIVYAASSLPLAILEQVVNHTGGGLLPSYRLLTIDFPEDIIETPALKDLPDSWHVQGPAPINVRQWGTDWLTSFRSSILRVPSVILSGREDDVNYLINPLHDDFDKVRVLEGPVDFPFDLRIKG